MDWPLPAKMRTASWHCCAGPQVGTRLQELPETAAAVHKAGIPRKRVPAVLYKHPSILSRPPGDVLDTGR
jgi:hypothetical protein